MVRSTPGAPSATTAVSIRSQPSLPVLKCNGAELERTVLDPSGLANNAVNSVLLSTSSRLEPGTNPGGPAATGGAGDAVAPAAAEAGSTWSTLPHTSAANKTVNHTFHFTSLPRFIEA